MVKAIFDTLADARPKNHFTVGIMDDVTHTSLAYDDTFDTEPADVTTALFYGLGADGTVGANKNSIKIIGEETDLHVQGYFVYDSKKAGATTVSHLRTSPRPIRSAYLISKARFVACHQFEFLERVDVLEHAVEGAVFLLNAPYAADEVWERLPREVQEQLIDKRIRFYTIDASAVARETGMGGRINTIMQTCFFAISGVLPREEAIAQIKHAIEKTYSKRGAEVVKRNFEAVDATLAHLHEVPVPSAVTATHARPPLVSALAPDFVQRITAVLLAGKGDLLPVSAFPVDGTWPVGTAKWEKRNLALEIPVWDQAICIQCNQCVLVCPHAAIRAKVYDDGPLADAPPTFKSVPYKGLEFKARAYTIQVAPEDCTGCNLCVNVCPAKDRTNPRHKAIDMHPQAPLRDAERDNYAFFLDLPDTARVDLPKVDHKTSQFLEPLFEYSGACAGCGETPYIKLLTQLFGDRALVANATGLLVDLRRQPADHAVHDEPRRARAGVVELAVRGQRGVRPRHAPRRGQPCARGARAGGIHGGDDRRASQRANCSTPTSRRKRGFGAQRERVLALRQVLAPLATAEARRLEALADYLVKKSIWLVGGDGWAYDIGYGGLDHVLASQRDVNILVLDTEVYSNTGGQQSKATPLGAVAKFAAAGKTTQKKDLGLLANMYGHVYVARVAFGAKMSQTVQAFLEAEAYPGTSLIIAYSHCIAHGYDMAHGATQQKLAVDSGVWPLYRFDPRRIAKGEPPMHLDYGPPKPLVAEYMRNESRFRVVERSDPARFKGFLKDAQEAARQRYAIYQQLAGITVPQLEVTTGDAAVPGRTGRGGMNDGPQHGVSRDEASPSAGGGSVTAGRRPRRRQTPRRRRRRGHRPAIAFRRADHAGADVGVHQSRQPRRIVRRGRQLLSQPRRLRAGPVRVPGAPATGEGSGPHSRHGVAERRDAGRLDRIRPSDGASRRGRAGAEPLSHRDRPGDDQRGHRAPGH